MRVLNWALDAQKTVGGKIISVILSVALIFSFSNFFYGDNAFADTEEDTKSGLVDQVSDTPAEENSEVVVPAKQTKQKSAATEEAPQVTSEVTNAEEAPTSNSDEGIEATVDTNITITYNATTGGTVSPSSETFDSATGNAKGSKATANKGYWFDNWTDETNNEVSTNATFIPENKVATTYTAHFSKAETCNISGRENLADIYNAYTIQNKTPIPVKVSEGATVSLKDAATAAGIKGGDVNAGPNQLASTSNTTVIVPKGIIQNINKAEFEGKAGAHAYLLYYNNNNNKYFLFEITITKSDGTIPDSLVYDANNGTGTMGATEGVTGGKVMIAANDFTREGYAFDGWNTKADGTGTAYAAGAEYTLTDGEDILYAQWAEDTVVDPTKDPDPNTPGDNVADKYQVTINYVAAENGTVTGTTTKVVTLMDGDKYVAEAAITPGTEGVTITPTAGYKFSNWTNSDPATEFQAKGGETYTYTANFVKDSFAYTVNYVDEAGNPVAAAKTGEAKELESTVNSSDEVIDIEGYVFESADKDSITIGADAGKNVITLTYTKDEVVDPTKDPDPNTPGDNVADKYQVTINYVAAENGTVTGTTTKVVTLMDGDKYVAEAAITPGTEGVTITPTAGYKFSNWTNSDPATEFQAKGGETYTYTANFEAADFPYTINYIDQATGNALQAPVTADATFGTEVTAEAVAIDGYVLVNDQQQTITMGVENNVINFYYAADTVGTDPTNPDQGDGIPDMYQARVDFVANNGTVNIGHTYVTLLDANGNPAVNGTGYLQQAQIPTATANDGFDQASLAWDTTPGIYVPIMGAMTFTANFTATPATPAPNPGDGGATTPAAPTPTPAPAAAPATPAAAPAAPAAPAAAPAAPAVVIPDEENPLAAPEQEIADDENPLAAFDHEECWVHWFMIAGILLTIIYGAVVVLRRTRNTKHIDKMEKDLIGTTDESTVTVGSAHHSHA